MSSSIYSFEFINVVVPDPKIVLGIPASAAYAAVVNLNGIKAFLSNGVSMFFINGEPFFSNGARTLPRNSPVCTVLDSLFFCNLRLVDKLITCIRFTKL